MTNTGLKFGISPVAKCKGQTYTAVMVVDSFKEKLSESMELSHATDL